MKKLLLMTITLFLLQGCTFNKYNENTQKITEDEDEALQKEVTFKQKNNGDYLYYYVAHSFSQANVEKEAYESTGNIAGVKTESNGYGSHYSFNGEKSLILSEVVSKMADQLLYNFPNKYHNEAIAVTSIVDLNNHGVTNWLGQTIAEQFIHELHIRRLRVIDFKLTGNIKLTEAGEFALTRDWKKLNGNLNVQRILTGTMSRNEEGIIFNIRIVNANSSMVESTSSAFIPNNMFVGGEYDYSYKKYYLRDTQYRKNNKAQVRLVK
ncbi:MAG: FlgO family outer membrane protein [Psychromonas sp.]